MNIKHYSTALLCTLFLTACGGSDNKNNTQNDSSANDLNTPEFQQWSSFYISSEGVNDQLEYEVETTTFDQGKMYTRYDYTDPTNIQSHFIVTANDRYDSGPVHQSYGALEGTIRINGNTWLTTPYSPNQSTDLTMTLVHKQIDISGKNMVELVMPDQYISMQFAPSQLDYMDEKYKKIYQALSNATFPSGSSCIQTQTVSNSEEYISLDLNSLEPDTQADLKSDWASLIQNTNYDKFTFKDTLAYINPESYWGIAQYQNQYYNVDYSPKGIEYDFNELLLSYKEYLDSEASAQEKDIMLKNFSLFENSCNFFNKTASDAIYSYINQYK